MQRSILLASVLAGLFGAACGYVPMQDGKKKSSGAPAAAVRQESGLTFPDDAALPECNAAREGSFVYVTATKSFRVCSEGAWSPIDLKGDKGDKGEKGEKGPEGAPAEPGSSAELEAAIKLYRDYRRSIFRVTLVCSRDPAQTQAACSGKTDPATFLGSAFLCGPKEICTNRHVVVCGTCYQLQSLSMQAVEGDTDSVNGDGTPATPFFSTTVDTPVRKHASRDLAKVKIDEAPAGSKPLPLATTRGVAALTPILSLSFPLGFQDLYVDLGAVNASKIGECSTQGGTSGYGCPSADYDFSTSNDTDHGSSGSPLIDVITGKVVGVVTAGTEKENANYSWAVDASRFAGVPE